MALIWMMSHRGGYKMGHITRYGIKIDTSDFRKFWHGTVAYNRDGCSSIYIIPFHKGKCTEAVIKWILYLRKGSCIGAFNI